MKRVALLIFLLILIPVDDLLSQAIIENKINFYEAESWVLYEDYKEALPLYLRLAKIYPGNANYKYRIGLCYLNIPGEKHKAISYLEEATRNINLKYKEGKFKENGAPYDSYFYLANAYMIDNQIDKALETYNIFKKNLNNRIYDSSIVNLQIKACYYAKEKMKEPVFIRQENLGSSINSTYSECNPVLSNDESMMIYTKVLPFYDAIMFSVKTDTGWNDPVNLNEQMKVDYNFYPTSISCDGKELFLYSPDNYDGVIYSSRFVNNSWSSPEKLNDNINTKYWESHATISHDNSRLIFTSNRKGTLGGLDIYVSSRDTAGEWGPASNLGPVINTPLNEETPFLSRDDKTLFFSSRGHLNMGGYDIFYSSLDDHGKWSVPLNAGYPLNSTDDDIFFAPVNEGYQGYFARYNLGGLGRQDIYRVEMYSDLHPRKFFVRGMVTTTNPGLTPKESIRIIARNSNHPDQQVVAFSDPLTGQYDFIAPQGNYEITYESSLGEPLTKEVTLPVSHPSDSILLPGMILPGAAVIAAVDTASRRQGSPTIIDTISSSRDTLHEKPPLTSPWIDSLVAVNEPVVKPEYGSVIARRRAAIFAELSKRLPDEKLGKIMGKIDTQVLQADTSGLLIKSLIEKIEAYSENDPSEEAFRLALANTGAKGILKPGEWFGEFYHDARNRSMENRTLADMFAAISSYPGTEVNTYAVDLALHSEEPSRSWIKSLNTRQERISTPAELILFTLDQRERKNIPDIVYFNGLANLVISNNIPTEVIKARPAPPENIEPHYLWLVPVAALIALIIRFFMKKRKGDQAPGQKTNSEN
jgi:tetratricopeptide (TPR) repeat protein